MKENSSTEENYLKSLYKLSVKGGLVSTNRVSRDLSTSAASVTDMLKKLSEKALVEYTPYKGARLTQAGQKIALKIVRKHRLWEVFLVKTLNFSWDQVHDTAEQLEHIESPELIEKLDEFLGFPKFDPHGDPIPSAAGEFAPRKTHLFSEIAPLETIKIAGVLNHSAEFLRFLDKLGLIIGVQATVVEKIEFDQSIAIQLGQKEMIISGETARNIIVVKTVH